MAISHELSGEIATALFAAKDRSPRELDDLKEMVFAIHKALEQLGAEPPAKQAASDSKQSAPDSLARHQTTGKA